MTTTVNQVMSLIRTYTGRLVDPIHLSPDDVCIEDIAHALSNQCRYSGHTRDFYSVAEHSVRVMKRCTLDPLAALLHDASEAYLVDLPRPLKHHPEFAFYREVEERVEAAIHERFGITMLPEIKTEIKTADNRWLATEMAGLMNRGDAPLPFEPYADYANVRLGLNSKKAERWFLANFEQLSVRPTVSAELRQ